MSGLDQLQFLSWIVYIVIFVAVLLRTIRRPTPAHVDMTLFFGAVVALIVINVLTARFGLPQPGWVADLSGGLVIGLGYLLLRLVRDFSRVPVVFIRIAEAAVVIAIAALAVLPTPMPVVPALLRGGRVLVVRRCHSQPLLCFPFSCVSVQRVAVQRWSLRTLVSSHAGSNVESAAVSPAGSPTAEPPIV